MMKMSVAMGLFAAFGAGIACAEGEEIVVGTGETLTTNIAADVENAATINVSDRAVISKTGAGTWALPSGKFASQLPTSVEVREGGVELTETAQGLAAYPEPTEVLAKALLHFDASATASIKLKEGSETEVEEWRDVRETGDGSDANPFVYVRAVTNFQCSATYPAVASYKEQTGIYFGGYGKGVWMNWVKPDGSQATCGKLRNVFIVNADTSASRGNLLGQRNGQSPYFQPATQIWMWHNGENKPMHASRTYLDGVQIDPFSTSYTAKTLNVIEVECLGDPQSAQCFFNDRDMQLTWPDGKKHTNAEGKNLNPFFNEAKQTGGGDRVGGGYLYEVILFDTQLTPAERLAVSDWLNQKWRNVTPPAAPTVSVTLASNTVARVSSGRLGNVTGDGTLVKADDGNLRIRSEYVARGSSALTTRIEAGTLDLGAARPIAVSAGDTVKVDTTRLGPQVSAPVAGTDKTKVVKTGKGPLTLDRIPDGVSKVEVKAGSLVLAAPECPSYAVRPETRVVKATPAATGGTFNFEEFHATGSKYKDYYNGNVAYGWHMVIPATTSGKANSITFIFDATSGEDKGENWNVTVGAHDGVCSLGIKNNASAWTEVVFPEDGIYVYSVWVAGRQGQTGVPWKLMLGESDDSLVEFGEIVRTDGNRVFHQFVFQTPFVTAGKTYRFWIKGPASGSEFYDKDICYQYDDMSFTKTVTGAPGEPYPIPNGDFETGSGNATMTTFSLNNTNKVLGFTVKQADNVGTATAANEQLDNANGYTTFSVAGTDSHAHFNLPWNRAGSRVQFYMTGNGSELTTTFTPPAGVWRFRADCSRWTVTASTGGSYDMEAVVRVGDGDEQSLGTVVIPDHKLVPRFWPGRFTVDGQTPVTLTVRGHVHTGSSCGHGILDNLELVPIQTASENLLTNGGCEDSSWKFVVTPKPANVYGSDYMQYLMDFCGQYFTRDFFEGTHCIKVVNDDTAYTTVTIPTPGLYRLSANFTSRCNPGGSISFGSGANPLAAYVAKGGVTNWLGVTDSLETTNFCETAFVFRVPEGEEGDYTVGFRGQSVWGGAGQPTVDRTSLVDGVMICPIGAAETMNLPADLDVDCAAGTRLTLDFDGTNTVSRIRINGQRYSGVVSVETHPELWPYLSGRGALYAEPRGTVIIFR